MKFGRFILLYLVACIAFQVFTTKVIAASDDSSSFSHIDAFNTLSPEWQEFIRLDSEYNVPGRPIMIRPGSTKYIAKLLQFDIPSDQLNAVAKSKYLDQDTLRLVETEKDGVKYTRIFAFENYFEKDKEKISFLKKTFGEPSGVFFATKLQSNSTYFVWNPLDKTQNPFCLKMRQFETNGGYNSVANSDLLIDFIKKNPDSNLAILPELYATKVNLSISKNESFNADYIIRSLKPMGKPKEGKLVPLHGFIGSGSMEKMAKQAGMSLNEWITNEYLPKLSKHFFEIRGEDGLYFDSHTQNLLIRIDEASGKIVDFVNRDLIDLMVDPYLLEKNGHLESFFSKSAYLKFRNILNRSKMDSAASKRVKEAGIHFGLYGFQTIDALSVQKSQVRNYAKIFIEDQIKLFEEKIGQKIVLSKNAQKALSLLSSDMPEELLENLVKEGDLLGTQAAAGIVMQDLQNQLAAKYAPRVEDAWTNFDQRLMTLIFKRKTAHGQIASLNPSIDFSSSAYAFDGSRVLVYDKNTKKILGFTFGLKEETIKELKNNKGISSCMYNFSVLLQHIAPSVKID